MNLIRHSPFSIEIREDSIALAEAVVDVLENRLLKRLSEVAPKPLGLATGRTMEPIYSSLVTRLKTWRVDALERLLREWCSFNLDEYVGLPQRDTRSFFSYMERNLSKPLQLKTEKIRVPCGYSEDSEREARLYLEQLTSLGGIGVLLLGLGDNGHVGFNEPPCSSEASCRVVSLAESTRKQNAFSFDNDLNQVPSKAITLGLAEILEAEEIHLIVTGSSKATILKELLYSPCSEKIPASWLRSHERVVLWADKEAFKEA